MRGSVKNEEGFWLKKLGNKIKGTLHRVLAKDLFFIYLYLINICVRFAGK